MSLTADVSAAIADAMRKKDPARLSALRMLKAAFMNHSIEKGHGRQDLADKEAAEIRVLDAYLPPAADPAAVGRAVDDAIAETGATSPKDTGRVMKAVMARLAGQNVDGKTVNELVRQRLAGG